MTDFTHHTPKLLTEADAAADLAGLPRPSEAPQALPRPVSSEDARAMADSLDAVDANPWAASIMLCDLVSERGALAVRVAELKGQIGVLSSLLGECRYPLLVAKADADSSGEQEDLENLAALLRQIDAARAALTTPESKP